MMRAFLLIMVVSHATATLYLGRNTWFHDSPNARALIILYILFNVGLTIEAFIQKHLTHAKRYNINFFLAIFTFLYMVMFITRHIA